MTSGELVRLPARSERQRDFAQTVSSETDIVESNYGSDQPSCSGLHPQTAQAVRGHTVSGVCPPEQHTYQQIRQLSKKRPGLRVAPRRSSVALFHRVETVPAFLVFSVEIRFGEVGMFDDVDRTQRR